MCLFLFALLPLPVHSPSTLPFFPRRILFHPRSHSSFLLSSSTAHFFLLLCHSYSHSLLYSTLSPTPPFTTFPFPSFPPSFDMGVDKTGTIFLDCPGKNICIRAFVNLTGTRRSIFHFRVLLYLFAYTRT